MWALDTDIVHDEGDDHDEAPADTAQGSGAAGTFSGDTSAGYDDDLEDDGLDDFDDDFGDVDE